MQSFLFTPDVVQPAPVTTISLVGTPGNGGWFRSPVTVTLTAVDPAPYPSGVLKTEYQIDSGAFTTYALPFTVSTEGATSVCAQSTDNWLALETPPTCSAFQIDTIAPVITLTTPVDRAPYQLRQVVNANWSATDGASPPASGLASSSGTLPSGAAINTATVGTKAFRVDAADVAGNTSAVPVTYEVQYRWNGFLNSKSTEKIGNTIPIKFGLYDFNNALVPTAAPTLTIVSPTGVSKDMGAIRFDATMQQYVYQLKTTGFAAGLWTFKVLPGDGTTKTLQYTLTVK
jgi:hypothetical protein